MRPQLWSDLTWEQVRDMRAEGVDLVIFPVGSTEQHGPHLPLNVDTLTVEMVAHGISGRTGVPVLPALPFGCSAGHTRRWPGTLSLSHNTLMNLTCEILEDVIAYGFQRVLILTGHSGNLAPLQGALETLRRSHPELQIAQKHITEASARVRAAYETDGVEGHANAAETALLLHLAPRLVRHDRIFDEPSRAADQVFSFTMAQTSKSGVAGTPSQATFEMGAELFEALVTDWTYLVKKALIEKPPLPFETEK